MSSSINAVANISDKYILVYRNMLEEQNEQKEVD